MELRVVLLGGPGAGKGTQARRIAKARGVPHISTGEIFRRYLRDGTDMGEKVRRYDLRRTILELALDLEDLDPPTLSMRLSLEQGRTGRPAQVLRALNLDAGVPLIARTAVLLHETGDQTDDQTADQADGAEPSAATVEERP